ncbi:MAG: hypothetical protein JOY62_17105 [Acidobacteriaceae bacterium]|nr:hypothetical protein [Acidobacteriaceae bacterium]MBV9781683.1 hypothetical protein [Acidobacteriaceae bacterium]
MSSHAQIEANRANSHLSTGPKTPEGKAKSSLNAVKTGLTGRTVLLPSDDAAAYQKHVQRFFDQYKPTGDEESALTQSLADTEWRLLRIPSLEMGIYAIGRLALAKQFEHEEDPQVRASLIEAQVFLTYRKDLNNLSIQEARLRKQREKDQAELQKLQHERKQRRENQMTQAWQLYHQAQKAGAVFDAAEFGFEFSTEEVARHAAEVSKKMAIYNHTYYDKKRAA